MAFLTMEASGSAATWTRLASRPVFRASTPFPVPVSSLPPSSLNDPENSLTCPQDLSPTPTAGHFLGSEPGARMSEEA
jgi:hypothetical protein